MQLNYKHEFAEALRSGTKIHTIRRKPVQPGTKLTHVIYPYHRERREVVLENTCTACQPISIVLDPNVRYVVAVGDRALMREDALQLFDNDGIAEQDCPKLFGAVFNGWIINGWIIHWTNNRY